MGGNERVRAYAPKGTFSVLADATSTLYGQLTTPAIAPSTFGAGAGNLFVTAQVGPVAVSTGGVLQVTPTGAVSVFYAAPALSSSNSPFGIVFAPAGFGSVGGTMLVSVQTGTGTDNIMSINANGQASLFASIPNILGGGDVRQMSFAPANFGAFSGDLLLRSPAVHKGAASLGRCMP